MRIKDLTAFHIRVPLRTKVRHASHTRSDTDSIVVRCRLDDGTHGWGEGLPRQYVTGDTIETVLAQFAATDWRRQVGDVLSDCRGAIGICDRMRLAEIGGPGHERDCFGNSLRCAVEISVLDAATRASQRPFSDITSLVDETAAIRRTRTRVRYSAAITPMGPVPEIIRALKIRFYGFDQAKIKVGVAGVDDREALRRARRILGSDFDLRIDANEAWSCRDLEDRVAPLLPLRISSLEQPVPHCEVEGLASLRGRLGVPIMLDESLCSMSDAERAIEQGTCDLFNVRLSKCGGFVPALRLAALARRAGLGFQLGCQVGETGILSAAGRHFASSVGDIRFLEGSFDRFLVTERLTVEDLTFGRGGWAPALDGPGLGVRIDERALERVTIAKDCRPVL